MKVYFLSTSSQLPSTSQCVEMGRGDAIIKYDGRFFKYKFTAKKNELLLRNVCEFCSIERTPQNSPICKVCAAIEKETHIQTKCEELEEFVI